MDPSPALDRNGGNQSEPDNSSQSSNQQPSSAPTSNATPAAANTTTNGNTSSNGPGIGAAAAAQQPKVVQTAFIHKLYKYVNQTSLAETGPGTDSAQHA
ncbi:Flocculation suppression protein [Diplodia seriata]|uniref:Flocculation suppression protein n=1 Tax=Diplodia seriata TaxID=420778 RepID=A0ABR3CWH6_9PEZI